MDTVQINWTEGVIRFNMISQSGNKYLDKNGFYCLLGARFDSESETWKDYKLLYIGQAFDQTLRERIPQDHTGYKCVFEYPNKNPGTGIVVMVGTVEKTNIQKITQDLFNDAECCLIFRNQSTCNEKCKENYSGRELQVINTGDFSPLKQECTCSAKVINP